MPVQLLTVQQTAQRLACSPWSVYQYLRTGVLPPSLYIRISGTIKILEHELDAWIAAQQAAQNRLPTPKPERKRTEKVTPMPKPQAGGR